VLALPKETENSFDDNVPEFTEEKKKK